MRNGDEVAAPSPFLTDAPNRSRRVAHPHSSENEKPSAARDREQEKNRRKYLARRFVTISRIVARQRERYHEDPEYMLRVRLRSRIKYAMKAGAANKAGSSADLIGCDAKQLRQYIESLFKPGMTWKNKGEWHIDHIIPVSAFDLTTSEGQRAAFHYSNLRPIWAAENRAKSSKVPLRQHRFPFGYVMLIDGNKNRARKGG